MPTQRIRTFDDFKTELEKSAVLQEQFKEDPLAAVNKIEAKNPLSNDVWIYRIIVLALGVTIVSLIIGLLTLLAVGTIDKDENALTILTAIGSAAIGALAGLLAPPPKSS